jgi:hypothetical protein
VPFLGLVKKASLWRRESDICDTLTCFTEARRPAQVGSAARERVALALAHRPEAPKLTALSGTIYGEAEPRV